jgi:hypothetical protein
MHAETTIRRWALRSVIFSLGLGSDLQEKVYFLSITSINITMPDCDNEGRLSL